MMELMVDLDGSEERQRARRYFSGIAATHSGAKSITVYVAECRLELLP